jgi:hypothetical protein
MQTLRPSRLAIRPRLQSLLLLALCLLPIGQPLSQPATPTSPSATRVTSAMNTYVILFRRGRAPLDDAEQQRLNQSIGPWAAAQNQAGHQLDPRLLAAENNHRGPHAAAAQAEALPLTALLFLHARDLDEATRVAESHPGMDYGFSVEVRPWAAPQRANPAPPR